MKGREKPSGELSTGPLIRRKKRKQFSWALTLSFIQAATKARLKPGSAGREGEAFLFRLKREERLASTN